MSDPIHTAAGYHRRTSYRRGALTPHMLDWANQPRRTKTYPDLQKVPLPADTAIPHTDYASLVTGVRTMHDDGVAQPDLAALSAVLRLTHTVTARSLHGGQPFYYRSVASAGALYPFELYLAVHQAEGLEAGLYHFDPFDFSLTRLRLGRLPIIPPVPDGTAATFYVSGIFFRSAWKYRSRAYRYVLLDAGHLLENLRLALLALGLPFFIQLDFDDHQAATLLGLDPSREVCLACVHLTAVNAAPAGDPPAVEPLSAAVVAASSVSDNILDYAAIRKIHQAGMQMAGASAADRAETVRPTAQPAGHWQPVSMPPAATGPDHARVLQQRRSRRNFVPEPLARNDLMALMTLLTASSGAGLPGDQRSVLLPGCLIGAGQPVPAGVYLLDVRRRQLGRVAAGDLMAPMAAACLDQMWLKNAAMHLLFMSDPAALDRNWGARGYRYAMIEAGRLGQQAYLAATFMGLGACGIGAIYDREAAGLLGLTDDGALLYLVGLGPVKRRSA